MLAAGYKTIQNKCLQLYKSKKATRQNARVYANNNPTKTRYQASKSKVSQQLRKQERKHASAKNARRKENKKVIN